ncbi:MAG: lamin tail domain-containing protein [Anaerolineae bacterium]|nr:lamin tail domain-containing protein [Anaerolineae bacterium]
MKLKRTPLVTLIALLVLLLTIFRPVHTGAATKPVPQFVVISEIAWMGTTNSPTHEWIELYNKPVNGPINLTGWTLQAADGTPSIALSGIIPAGGYFLLERTNDGSVPGVAADQIYTGALGNNGEHLLLYDSSSTLIDEVDCAGGWYAGHDRARVPMVRVDTYLPGTDPSNWTYNPRCGTATNSAGATYECPYTVYSTSDPLYYAVYFNERATTASGPTIQPTAMENALLDLIDRATTSIDIALYGLNRQSVVDALIAAHNAGVTVRVVGDDEAATSAEYGASYQALTNAGITIVTDTSLSKIQHNKFLVLDGSVVWTGSTNLTDTCLTLNANSSIAITDTVLAGSYTAEFEEMWAGSFSGDKTVNTIQHLDYGGTLVESYFSPTDWPAFEVWLELAKAEETIHFAMFFWTDELLSRRVMERLRAGVEVYGVWDQLGASNVASQDELLCAAGARIGIENLPGKVHHKFAVIDVEGDDPVVIVSSYNWTEAGAYDNDENTLIIHDHELARAYYAEWQRLWATVPEDRVCEAVRVYLPVVQNGYTSP